MMVLVRMNGHLIRLVGGDGQRFLKGKLPKQPPRTEIKVVLGLFNTP